MSGFIAVMNFEKFQHYRDRRPPWIKLYRDILDDDRFFDLSDQERYHLIGLFILASQHDNQIPNKPEWLKHQLRTQKAISLQRLIDTGWIKVVGQDASTALAECKQDAIVETEKRREENTGHVGVPSEYPADFEEFWAAYPKKRGKGGAFAVWKRNGHPGIQRILEVLAIAKRSYDWTRDRGQFIPNPETWLNQKRWDDEYRPLFNAGGDVVV